MTMPFINFYKLIYSGVLQKVQEFPGMLSEHLIVIHLVPLPNVEANRKEEDNVQVWGL